MKSTNTLNTRLLPLSILVSSLISGGAMAVDGNVNIVAPQVEQQVVEPVVTAPEVEAPKEPSMLDKLKELLGVDAPAFNAEQEKKIAEFAAKKADEVKKVQDAKLAHEEAEFNAKMAAEHEGVLTEADTLAKNDVKEKEQAETEAKGLKANAKKISDVAIAKVKGERNTPLDPKDSNVLSAVNQALDSATKKVELATLDLAEKTELAEAAKLLIPGNLANLDKNTEETEANTKALVKAEGAEKNEAKDALTAANEKLDAKQKKDKDNDGYQELFDAHTSTKNNLAIAEKDENKRSEDEKRNLATALENESAYKKAAATELEEIEAAKGLVAKNTENTKKLTEEKQQLESSQRDLELEKAKLTQQINGAKTAENTLKSEQEAEKAAIDAQKTLLETMNADKAAAEAETAHQEAKTSASEVDKQLTAAKSNKIDADNLVNTKNGELDKATSDLAKLVKQQNADALAANLPTVDEEVGKSKIQEINADQIAIGSKVAEGTQTVNAGGKAFNSVVTEDGTVELEEGGFAKGTVLTKGTLNNTRGEDVNTAVGAEGVLNLTGATAAKMAKSTGATVAVGGKVNADGFSVIENMTSSGNVIAKGTAAVHNSTIDDGTLALSETATADNITLKGGIFTLADTATAKNTNVNGGTFTVEHKDTVATATTVNGGTFDVQGDAEVEGTTVNAGDFKLAADAKADNTTLTGGTFALADNATADNTTLTSGAFTLADNAKADNTTLTSGAFALADNATADNTTLTGGTFTLADNATADNTAVNGGTFTVKSKDTTATATTIGGGTFDVQGDAAVDGTTLSAGNFLLAGTATANNTTATGGTFNVADDAVVTQTNMTNGTLNVKGKAKITDTTLVASDFMLANNANADKITATGGSFTMADQSTASDITLTNSDFTLGNAAKVTGATTLTGGNAQIAGSLESLSLTNGNAKIAGSLESLSLTGGRVDFANSANLSGLIDTNADSVITIANGANTAQADLNLSGRLELLASDVAQAVAQPATRAVMDVSNSRAVMPSPMPMPVAAPVAKFALKDVNMANSTIDMSKAKNAQLTMNSLNGKGNFDLGSIMETTSVAPLNVTGAANGEFVISMNDSGKAPTNLNVIETHGGDAQFRLANGPVALGNYMNNLVKDANGNFILNADKAALTPSTAGILAVANTTPVIFNAELSSIQQRLDKQSTETNQSGMWGSYLNNNFEVKGRAANFDQKLNGMTLGGDKATELADGVLSIGGFASYSSSDVKTDYQSKGKVDSHSFGAYAQFLANNGYYMNAIVKNNQFSQDVNISSLSGSASGTSNFGGMGIALKAGKHFNFNEAYVSPYAAMSAFSSGKNTITLSNGMEAQSKSSRSTIGTIGVNAGYRFVMNNGAEIKPYAIFSVDHEFAKNNQVMVNNEVFDNSLNGTRVNTGAGLNVNITPNLSVGSEVKLSSGKDIKTPVTINLNMGYNF